MEIIKTIDVIAKEWFDKVNGNSYFAGSVTVNFGMKDEFTFNMPFQYGYGEQYETEAKNQLEKRGYLKTDKPIYSLYTYCQDNNIIYRANKERNCKQRELKAYNK